MLSSHLTLSPLVLVPFPALVPFAAVAALAIFALLMTVATVTLALLLRRIRRPSRSAVPAADSAASQNPHEHFHALVQSLRQAAQSPSLIIFSEDLFTSIFQVHEGQEALTMAGLPDSVQRYILSLAQNNLLDEANTFARKAITRARLRAIYNRYARARTHLESHREAYSPTGYQSARRLMDSAANLLGQIDLWLDTEDTRQEPATAASIVLQRFEAFQKMNAATWPGYADEPLPSHLAAVTDPEPDPPHTQEYLLAQ